MENKENKENKQGNKLIKDVFEFNRWLYNITGFGSPVFPTKCQEKLYKSYQKFMQLSFFTQLSLFYRELVLVSDNLTMLSFTLSFVIFTTVGVIKIFVINSRRKEVEETQKRLDEYFNLPWTGKEKWEKEVSIRNSDYFVSMCTMIYLLVFAGGSLTFALPLVTNSRQKFFIPFSYGFIVKTPFYGPVYAFQSFLLAAFLLNFVSNDMIFFGLIIRMCENLEIVEVSLKESTIPDNSMQLYINSEQEVTRKKIFDDWKVNYREQQMRKRFNTLIKRCIIHHQAVLRELKVIISIYGFPIILHFIFGPFLCGFIAYVIFSDLDEDGIILQQICYVVPVGSYLLIYCYFGTHLSKKFNDVRFAFYSCPWYDMDFETRKLIVIVLAGLGKLGRLTAGNIFEVALTTYLTLAKTAYNFVTLLRNIV